MSCIWQMGPEKCRRTGMCHVMVCVGRRKTFKANRGRGQTLRMQISPFPLQTLILIGRWFGSYVMHVADFSKHSQKFTIPSMGL